jgi:vacuolar-type H+-ATPase subunit H
MPEETKPPAGATRAQQIVKEAPEELQKLIRDILAEERKVMHKERRPNIHQNIYDHVKRLIR